MSLDKYFRDIFSQYKIKDFFFSIVTLTSLLFVLDYFDIPSSICTHLGIAAIFVICVFIFFGILSLNVLGLLRLKTVNYIDFYPPVISISLLLYLITVSISNRYLNPSILNNVLIALLFINLLIIVVRYFYITFNTKKTIKPKFCNNVFDLKELYDDTIPREMEFFFINDEPADYDILERERIIQQMSDTINSCQNESRFVISLKGPWGSGKTTVINNVKKKINIEDVIFIDDFEPWIYSDTRSLLIAFFDKIMENVNCKFRIKDVNTFTKIYLRTLNPKFGPIDRIFNNVNIERIKQIINNSMIANNKRIVLVLDNLERCSGDQIVFLLKTIYGLFDFKRILYILSYDDREMRKRFDSELNLDYSYMEKIIQLEFNMPKLSVDVLKNVINKCLINYLSHSKSTISNKELKEIVQIIAISIKDLRELKRIINSVFNISLRRSAYLNSIDALLIEFIALKNPDLWYEISENSQFYTSEDLYVYDNEYIYKNEKYNEDLTKYFNNLFSHNRHKVNEYKSILTYLFPNVKKYLDNRKPNNDIIEFIPENSLIYSDNEREKYKKSVTQKRIFNSKFFNLYFYKVDNEFSIMDQCIHEFIDYLNNSIDIDKVDLYKKYIAMEKCFPGWMEKYTLETFELLIDKINRDKLIYLLCAMILSYYYVNSEPLFLQLDAQKRTEVIIAEILKRIPDKDFSVLLQDLYKSYQNIYLIRQIVYWLKPRNQSADQLNEERYKQMDSLFQNMKQDIISDKVDLYNTNNYGRYNASIFFDNQDYIMCIKKNLNTNNLMLFVSDCIGFSTGTDGVGYIINKKRIEEIYGWKKMLKDINNCPNCELKNFLVIILREAEPDDHEDGTITYKTDTWRDLDSMIIDFISSN